MDIVGYGTTYDAYSDVSRLIGRLRVKLRDKGSARTDVFSGDGVTSAFDLTAYPVKEYSESVFIDLAPVAASGYALQGDVGELSFSIVPASGASIKVVYAYYEFSDEELDEAIRDAVDSINAQFGTEHLVSDIGAIAPALSAAELRLVSLVAMREVYVSAALEQASQAFDWTSKERSVSKSSLTTNYDKAIALLEDQIGSLSKDLIASRITGRALSGGTEPNKFSVVDWTSSNA